MSWRDFSKHIRHLTPTDQQKVEEAFLLGEQQHRGQLRASGEPFFSHPIAVAQYLSLLHADAETLIAALLHDAVEDTSLTVEDVRARFGEKVAVMIQGLTKLDESALAHQPSLDEKIETLRRMFGIMEKDVRIVTIKLADRLHNMQTIGFRPADKQREVAKETKDLYVKIADRLCMRDLRDELTILCHGILEPELHDVLLALRERNRKLFSVIAPTLHEQLAVHTPDLQAHIAYEPKSWEGLHMQYELEQKTSKPSPLLNASFLCESVEECYRTLGAIHLTWPRIVLTFDDFINVPAINGYRGLQTTVVLPDGTHLRCKIRTHGMDAYARRGIATICFDTQARGVLSYLPWTRHIGPLANDTRDRSTAFWETLQNDILNESFVIYGNEHRSALVPKNATALDGALYLYSEQALHLTAIFVNGTHVPLSHMLMRADAVEIVTDDQKQVERAWLQWSNTGIGSVLIRTALSEQDWSVKVAAGKALLQEHLHARHRGYLSEFNLHSLTTALQEYGITTNLDKLYVQLAEGRVLPQDIERALYPHDAKKETKTSLWVVHCRALMDDWNTLSQILSAYHLLRIRAKRDRLSRMTSITATCRLTAEEAQELEGALGKVKNADFRLTPRREGLIRPFAWLLLFLLWGADPVVAYLLLQRPDIHPINLTAIRFMSYVVVMGMVLLWMQRYRPIRHARLSLRNRSLWLTAIFLFLVSLTTYMALQQTLPLHYSIPMTIAGLFLTSVLHKRHIVTQVAVWGLAVTGLWTLVVRSPDWSINGMVFTALAVTSFTLFSVLSERYKRQEEVSNRIVQYLFLASALCTLFSIPFLIIWGIGPMTQLSLLLSIGFAIGISGSPYFIYYYLLSHSDIDIGMRFSFLAVPTTFLFQILLISAPTYWTLAAAAIVISAAIITATQNPIPRTTAQY